jgi:hypothetical protein
MSIARALGAGRATLGVTLLIAPDLLTSRWVGRRGASPAGRVLARGLGARDVGIGVGVLASSTATARPWILAGVAADAADMAASAATLGIPAAGRVGTAALAGASAALGVGLLRTLD